MLPLRKETGGKEVVVQKCADLYIRKKKTLLLFCKLTQHLFLSAVFSLSLFGVSVAYTKNQKFRLLFASISSDYKKIQTIKVQWQTQHTVRLEKNTCLGTKKVRKQTAKKKKKRDKKVVIAYERQWAETRKSSVVSRFCIQPLMNLKLLWEVKKKRVSTVGFQESHHCIFSFQTEDIRQLV